MSQEKRKIQENKNEKKEKLWVRSATIRPHHLTLDPALRDAISGTTPVEELAHDNMFNRFHNKIARRGIDNSGYDEDVVEDSFQGKLKQITTMRKYFHTLRTLPDSAYVGLDLDPDGYCDSCPIGKHCTGTNYESTQKPRSTFLSEVGQLLIVEAKLKRHGFVKGVDYERVPTEHTLYNYSGRVLADSTPGIAEEYIFPSITVQMGALRKICQSWN